MTAVLQLDRVSVIRQGRRTLNDVSLCVEAGEQWAIVGPNGAGKSTLLAVCSTATWPSLGSVSLFGEELGRHEVTHLRERVGYVTAHHQLDWPLTAREVVLTGLLNTLELPMRWRPSPKQLDIVNDQLKRCGLAHVADTPWRGLSQGELGRTLLARAMLREPRLLLLDEPAAGLDLGAREQLLETIADHVAGTPELATLLVTHHLEELPATTTHALVMTEGRVVRAGEVATVLTSDTLSQVFGFRIDVTADRGRWTARLVRERWAAAE